MVNRTAKIVLGAIVSIALLVGAIGIAYAADPTPTPNPNAPQGWQRGPMRGPQGNQSGPQGAQPNPGPGRGRGFGFQGTHDELLKLLGMTDQQIRDARLSGQSLAQIAASKGISKDKLVETILAGRKTALDARVKAGTMTQAQADAAFKVMQDRVNTMVDGTEVGRPAGAPGMGMGPGMMHHRQMGGPPTPPDKNSPDKKE